MHIAVQKFCHVRGARQVIGSELACKRLSSILLACCTCCCGYRRCSENCEPVMAVALPAAHNITRMPEANATPLTLLTAVC